MAGSVLATSIYGLIRLALLTRTHAVHQTRAAVPGAFEKQRAPRVPHAKQDFSGLGTRAVLDREYQPRPRLQQLPTISTSSVSLIVHTMSKTPDPLPPSYSQATAGYTVGRHQTHPLIHARHLQGHLEFLRAFDTLRRDVTSADVSRFPPEIRTVDRETRWGWFVSLAVER